MKEKNMPSYTRELFLLKQYIYEFISSLWKTGESAVAEQVSEKVLCLVAAPPVSVDSTWLLHSPYSLNDVLVGIIFS